MSNRAGRRRRQKRHKRRARDMPASLRSICKHWPQQTLLEAAILREDQRYKRWHKAKYARPSDRMDFADIMAVIFAPNPLFDDIKWIEA